MIDILDAIRRITDSVIVLLVSYGHRLLLTAIVSWS